MVGSIDVDRGGRLHADLSVTLRSLVLDTHLHLLALVTPYDLVEQVKVDWRLYLHEVRVRVRLGLGLLS